MKSMMSRTTVREIRHSLGRYIAILAIVALGVGFFAGLKVTKPAMLEMADTYLKEMQLFDYRLLSTLGFREEDVESVKAQPKVRSAQGAVSGDIIYKNSEGNESVMKVHSLTENINGVELLVGRMPEKANECVVDANLYDASAIGEKIILSDNNETEDLDLFAYTEYTIVGVVRSSYYINFERGTTSLASGRISGFMYIDENGFDVDYYTEIFVKFEEDFSLYSEEYENDMKAREDDWEKVCAKLAQDYYLSIKTEAQEEIDDAKAELAGEEAEAEKELSSAHKELLESEKELADGEAELKKAKQEIADKEAELSDAQKQMETARQELSRQEEQLLLMAQNPQTAAMAQAAQNELVQAKAQLEAQQSVLDSGKSEIEKAKVTVEEETEKLEDGKTKLAEGFREYEEAKAEFDEKIADARKEIADAEEKIAELEEPDTYVLGRGTNIGYACFENDSDIVEGIANVFPIFFFLVAALVCMTTMNRMIEEQRTQIGVLKALGYGEGAIMGKYLFYSGSAATAGCISGFFGGTWLFPKVIWAAYGMMYNMPRLGYVFGTEMAVISLTAALLCSMGITWLTCRYELSLVAAELMRPKAPKAGKRVFLEYLPFLWKRMKFLYKVSIRNIVRYKRRFFMMIIGISGCTALLVTGFGVKDSVADVAGQQYGEIQIYDMGITFENGQTSEKETEFSKAAAEGKNSYAFVCEKTPDLLLDGKAKSVTMVIFEKEEQQEQFLNLATVKEEKIAYPKEGEAVITNGIAEKNDISVGDEIVLQDEELKEIKVKVSKIAKNFVYDYVYLNCETYSEQMGEEPEYKTAYVNLSDEENAHRTAAGYMKMKEVAAVTVNADTQERFSGMMESLDYVVLLVISCAAVLAFIVLYNLTNINITERIREIATIKVLGFYKKETAAYVFRENVALTAIGSVVGLLLGYFLHAFVMSQIVIDMVSFDVHIKPVSYLYSIALTFLFAAVVNGVMSFKLEQINMAESLKSVD